MGPSTRNLGIAVVLAVLAVACGTDGESVGATATGDVALGDAPASDAGADHRRDDHRHDD